VEPDYFTTALTNSRVTILDTAAERAVTQGQLHHGDVEVIETVTGYKKIKFVTHENAGYGDVRLPDLQMHTTAFWWTLDNPAAYLERWSPARLIDGLRGAGAALETVASISLMCEPRDIGRTLGSEDLPVDRDGYRPTLFLYDALPGGVGLARRIFERAEDLLSRASRLIASCRCESGCPACIGAAFATAAVARQQPISGEDAPTRATAATAEVAQRGTLGRKAVAIALLEGLSSV
jgi:DEAD/DEAH box helicase domain-containing protein